MLDGFGVESVGNVGSELYGQDGPFECLQRVCVSECMRGRRKFVVHAYNKYAWGEGTRSDSKGESCESPLFVRLVGTGISPNASTYFALALMEKP